MDVSRAMAARRTRHLFIVDLAVPRDVDPSAVYVPGVTLLTADAVQRVREATLAHRAAEIPAVETIVDEELSRLAGRCRREVASAVEGLRLA